MLGKIIRGSIIVGNIGAIVWLLLCLLASYYDTSSAASYISLFSFTCLFAFLANVLFAVIWFFTNRKKRAIASIIVIALCWRVVQPSLGMNIFSTKVSDAYTGGLKVMTWNVHMFDLGEWTKDNSTTARILNLISEEDPDILCMQEYFRDAKNHKEPYTDLIMKSGYGYTSFSMTDAWHKSFMTSKAGKNEMVEVGTMIFSKYPIKNIQTNTTKSNDPLFHTVEVTLDNGKTFTLMTLHLTSVKFGMKEQDYIKDIKSQGIAGDDEKAKSKHLAYKLKTASHVRATVANAVAENKNKYNLPMIITGDFNDMPGSYVYHTIKGELGDAFVAKGFGLGRTYQYIFPTLRIDNIFYDKEMFKVEGIKTIQSDLSDHNPVIAYLSVK